MAGRKVTIPDKPKRILPYDAKISVLLFPVASDIMVARALLPGSKKYSLISDRYNKMSEADMKNIEEILISNTQLIITGAYISSEIYSRFDKLQQRTGIPVVVVDSRVEKLVSTYTFLGKILGIEATCNKRSEFIAKVFDDAEKQWKKSICVLHNRRFGTNDRSLRLKAYRGF